MHPPNLIIADPFEDFRQALTLELEEHFRIFPCRDGYEASAAVGSVSPAVLVIDPTLSGIDGVSVLQKAASQASPPVTLVTSRFLSDYLLDALHRLNVAYVMSKPCDIHCISTRIFELSQRLMSPSRDSDISSRIAGLLLSLSLRPKLAGYTYLAEGILQLSQRPEQSITKELYPAIAALHRTTVDAVERSMRTAISGGWKRMEAQVWRQFFPADAAGVIPRPTNADFLSRLAAAVSDPGFSRK